MKHLIVAHYREPMPWLPWVAISPGPWAIHVVSNGVHRPNVGREAGAYLWWILGNYDRIRPHDSYAFVQADPFPHCADIIDRLNDPVLGWRPFGDLLFDSQADGRPHHGGLPVGRRFEEITGEVFPGNVKAYAGGQFACRGVELLAKPRGYWESLAVIADDEATGGPWVLERLWAVVFEGVEVTVG